MARLRDFVRLALTAWRRFLALRAEEASRWEEKTGRQAPDWQTPEQAAPGDESSSDDAPDLTDLITRLRQEEPHRRAPDGPRDGDAL